jgi:putative Ca2+/H+ antiporter (TMEM165/GDT1 family)
LDPPPDDVDPTWQPEVSNVFNMSTVTGEPAFNVTEHRGFLHGFVESLSVILVSEIGDKTFFIAAIMAMGNNKLTVFLGAISALAVMTVLSALLGFVVTTFIPREYTYYTCTAIMFLFGIKMLWEAWRMKPNEGEETQKEVEEEVLARHGSSPSLANRPADEETDVREEEMMDMNPDKEDAIENVENDVVTKSQVSVQPIKRGAALRVRIREKSWFGKKCLQIFKLFTNTFIMTFLAEWGDRSQLATIVMAGINDVSGVCLGGVLGHFICTGLAGGEEVTFKRCT